MTVGELSILLVEDDPDARQQLQMLLELEVGRLEVAENGKEGLKKIEERRPDIVLTDIDMPEMDGLTMTRILKAMHPDIHVIVASANDDKETLHSAIQAGVDAFLFKPVDFDKLLAKLESTANETKRPPAAQPAEAIHFDPLTHLPDRRFFDLNLEKAINRAKRHDYMVAVLLMDIEDFKTINERYGHLTGDHVLKRVADILDDITREADTVARLRGDLFGLIAEHVQYRDNLEALAKKLLEAVERPILHDGVELSIRCKIGIGCYPACDTADTAETLFRQARKALARAKETEALDFAFCR